MLAVSSSLSPPPPDTRRPIPRRTPSSSLSPPPLSSRPSQRHPRTSSNPRIPNRKHHPTRKRRRSPSPRRSHSRSPPPRRRRQRDRPHTRPRNHHRHRSRSRSPPRSPSPRPRKRHRPRSPSPSNPRSQSYSSAHIPHSNQPTSSRPSSKYSPPTSSDRLSSRSRRHFNSSNRRTSPSPSPRRRRSDRHADRPTSLRSKPSTSAHAWHDNDVPAWQRTSHRISSPSDRPSTPQQRPSTPRPPTPQRTRPPSPQRPRPPSPQRPRPPTPQRSRPPTPQRSRPPTPQRSRPPTPQPSRPPTPQRRPSSPQRRPPTPRALPSSPQWLENPPTPRRISPSRFGPSQPSSPAVGSLHRSPLPPSPLPALRSSPHPHSSFDSDSRPRREHAPPPNWLYVSIPMHEWRNFRSAIFSQGTDEDRLAFKLLQELILSPTTGIPFSALAPLSSALQRVPHVLREDCPHAVAPFASFPKQLQGELIQVGKDAFPLGQFVRMPHEKVDEIIRNKPTRTDMNSKLEVGQDPLEWAVDLLVDNLRYAFEDVVADMRGIMAVVRRGRPEGMPIAMPHSVGGQRLFNDVVCHDMLYDYIKRVLHPSYKRPAEFPESNKEMGTPCPGK